YFLGAVLGIEAVENPEEQLTMSALDRGDLVHRALEQFIAEVLARPAADQPAPDQPWTDADRARLIAIGDELCEEYKRKGLTGRDLFWRRERVRILADLERFLVEDDRHRLEHHTRPIATERPFGFAPGAADAVPLALADGRSVRFRGKADRVDRADDGSLHIVDYKTGD